MKITSLNPETACSFQPPANINFARIKSLDQYLRKFAKAEFIGRKGRIFYFNFQTSAHRDAFLFDLEQMITIRGNQTERVTQPAPVIRTSEPLHPLTGTISRW